MTLGKTPPDDSNRRLLIEIGGLADHVRDLRQTDAVTNRAEIISLTADMRTKWDEMRALRAPPVSDDLPERYRGGHYG